MSSQRVALALARGARRGLAAPVRPPLLAPLLSPRTFLTAVARGGAGIVAALGLVYVAYEAGRRLEPVQRSSIRRSLFRPQPELAVFTPGRLFLQRPDKLAFLEEMLAADPSGPIVIAGPQGSGKTAALKQALKGRFQTCLLDLRAQPVASGEALALAFVEQAGFLMPPRELLGRAIFAASATSTTSSSYETEKALRLIREVLREDKKAGRWVTPGGPDGMPRVSPPILAIDELNASDTAALADDAAFWRMVEWILFVTDNRLANIVICCSTDVADLLDAQPAFRARRHRIFFGIPRAETVAHYFRTVVNPTLLACGAVRRPSAVEVVGSGVATSALPRQSQREGAPSTAPRSFFGRLLRLLRVPRPFSEPSAGPPNAGGPPLAALAVSLQAAPAEAAPPAGASLAAADAPASAPVDALASPQKSTAQLAQLTASDGEGPSAALAYARAAALAALAANPSPPAATAAPGAPAQALLPTSEPVPPPLAVSPSVPVLVPAVATPPAAPAPLALAPAAPASAAPGSATAAVIEAADSPGRQFFEANARFEFAPWGRTQRGFFLLEENEILRIVDVIGGNLKDLHTVVSGLLAQKHYAAVLDRLVADSVEQVESALDLLLVPTDGGIGGGGGGSGGSAVRSLPSANAGTGSGGGLRRGLRLRLQARAPLLAHDFELLPSRGLLAAYQRFLRAWALLEELAARKHVQRREVVSKIFSGLGHELDSLVEAGLALSIDIKGLSKVEDEGGSEHTDAPGTYVAAASPRMRAAFKLLTCDDQLQHQASRVRAAVRLAFLREEEQHLIGRYIPEAVAERAFWHGQLQALLARDTALRSSVAKELVLLQAAAPVSGPDFLASGRLEPLALAVGAGETAAGTAAANSPAAPPAASPAFAALAPESLLLGVRALNGQYERALKNLGALEAEVAKLRQRHSEIRTELSLAEATVLGNLQTLPRRSAEMSEADCAVDAALEGVVALPSRPTAAPSQVGVEASMSSGGSALVGVDGRDGSDIGDGVGVKSGKAGRGPFELPPGKGGLQSPYAFTGNPSPFFYDGAYEGVGPQNEDDYDVRTRRAMMRVPATPQFGRRATRASTGRGAVGRGGHSLEAEPDVSADAKADEGQASRRKVPVPSHSWLQ